jgi:HK97 family phage major capsid protein
LQAGVAGVLLGYPVHTDDYMPDVASGSLSIAFGDFKRAYLIYRRRGMRIIRDNITNKGFTSFWVTERFGGGVQNFEAVKLMKFSAS